MTTGSPKKSVMTIPPQREIDAFVEAAGRGDISAVVSFLDKYPAAIDHENSGDVQVEDSGHTALFLAAGTGQIEVVKLLLEKGADVNKQTNYGWTPLITAVGRFTSGHRDTDMADLLLENGADIDAKNKEGRTAVDLAREYASPEMVRFLEQWPEIKKQRQEARELAEDIADFSAALKRDLPATSPPVRKMKP